MGYTNYWNKSKTIPQKDWDEFIIDCKKIYKNLPTHVGTDPLYLNGCFNKKSAAFNKQEVMFNGGSIPAKDRVKDKDGNWSQDELSHETFYLGRVYAQDDWSFCKTARKPYDLMVMIVLILAVYHFGDKVFSFTSDGDDEDDYCHEAYKVISEVLGKSIILPYLIA